MLRKIKNIFPDGFNHENMPFNITLDCCRGKVMSCVWPSLHILQHGIVFVVVSHTVEVLLGDFYWLHKPKMNGFLI